jgi:hypothetical protein
MLNCIYFPLQSAFPVSRNANSKTVSKWKNGITGNLFTEQSEEFIGRMSFIGQSKGLIGKRSCSMGISRSCLAEEASIDNSRSSPIEGF